MCSSDLTQRVQEVYESLLATLVEDRGPELLAEVVNAVTAKAVYLLDEHFQPTVQTGGDRFTAEAVGEVSRRAEIEYDRIVEAVE